MWDKNKNIRDSSHWMARKTELIELKENQILTSTRQTIYRGGIFNVELGNGNIGGEKNKIRPCLVISKDSMNRGDTVIVIPLSTKFKIKTTSGGVIIPYYKHHYIIKKSKHPFLIQDSCLKTEDVRSVDKVRIRDLLGNIDVVEFNSIKSRITDAFGF